MLYLQNTENNMSKIICGTPVPITTVRHDMLKDIISKEYGADWSLIAGKGRYPELVEARRCYYSILRNVFYYKLQDIGRETNQDHSTVIASLKAHDKYISVYKSERLRYLNVNFSTKLLAQTTVCMRCRGPFITWITLYNQYAPIKISIM